MLVNAAKYALPYNTFAARHNYLVKFAMMMNHFRYIFLALPFILNHALINKIWGGEPPGFVSLRTSH